MSSISKVGAAVAAILIVSSWRVAHAQPREINSQRQTWPVKPFDPNTGVQPAGFKGHNPVTVAALAAALKGKLKKSEYETRDEWQHRLDAFRHAKITPLLTVDSTLAFVVRNSGDQETSLWSRYDAEGRHLNVWFPANEINYSIADLSRTEAQNRRSVRVYEGRDSSTYLGQNSFGARATVTKTVLTVVELNYGIDDETPLSQDIEYPNSTSRFGPEGVALQIDCTPQEAPRVKSNLAAVAVFVMEAPYFSQGRDVSTPTLSRPRSLDERISQVYGRIDEIWLFNTANGKIYG